MNDGKEGTRRLLMIAVVAYLVIGGLGLIAMAMLTDASAERFAFALDAFQAGLFPVGGLFGYYIKKDGEAQ